MWVTAFSHQYLLWGNVLVHCHVMSVFLETNIVRLIQMNLEKFGWLVYLQAFLGKEHNNKKLPHNYIIRKRNPAIHPTEKPVSLLVSSKSRDWSWNWHWYWIYWEMATMDVDRWRWLWTSSVSSCGLTNSDLGTSMYCLSTGLLNILTDMNFPLQMCAQGSGKICLIPCLINHTLSCVGFLENQWNASPLPSVARCIYHLVVCLFVSGLVIILKALLLNSQLTYLYHSGRSPA